MITIAGWSLRAPSQLTRLVVLGALSAGLMIADHRGQQLETLRAGLTAIARPVLYVAALPAQLGSMIADFFTTSEQLRKELSTLRSERQAMQMQVQRLEATEADNRRLRDMLGAANAVADRALAAELLEVTPEPSSRKIILDRGSRHGVYVGQPVIDAYGVIGQVTQVATELSRVTLLTDPGHAIPALVNRSGLRVLVFGTGAETLRVPYLTARADIREGDLLVSSGMGGTFPPGYPVARVDKIVNDPNESFLSISAHPAAQLNHNKQALLVWPGTKTAAGAQGKGAAKGGAK